MSLLILAPEWCRFIHSAQVALNRTGPFIEEELPGKSLGGEPLFLMHWLVPTSNKIRVQESHP